MDHLIILSTDCPISPTLTLSIPELSGHNIDPLIPLETPPKNYLHALGICWYPPDDSSATIIKELQQTPSSRFGLVLKDWEQFHSTVFFFYIRRATKKIVRQYIQPFTRTYASHDWAMSLLGSLPSNLSELLPLGANPIFEPIGKSPSEYVFCWLMNRIREKNSRSIADASKKYLYELFSSVNAIAPCNIVLSDGKDIIVYQGKDTRPVYFKRIIPPIKAQNYRIYSLDLNLGDDFNRTIFAFSSVQPEEQDWPNLNDEQMLVVRQGTVLWDSEEKLDEKFKKMREENISGKTPDTIMVSPALAIPDSEMIVTALDETLLHVFHETIYRYEIPVEFSKHYIRLFPIHDRNQQVLSHQITISTNPVVELFEDVFENITGFFQMRQTFSELKITMEGEILVRAPTEGLLGSPTLRQNFPVIWMPWQRQIMMPYLLPIELPESQLSELNFFARSFIPKNDNDVIAVLEDINQTIFRDFTYDTGTTNIHTTPYDVYVNRHGVCQDFANLFICLSRLLGIPARYRVGYIYTGHDYDRRIQSDASHAWVEVYLPWIGWKGYDPTNGCPVGTHHVRVSCGRNYYDPPPTAGTIYKGGYGEKLEVHVRVRKVDQNEEQ